MNEIECSYISEANRMCNTLVNEVSMAATWSDMQDAIWAIQHVRSKAKNHIAEWEHLNNPSPGSNHVKDANETTQAIPAQLIGGGAVE